MNLKNVKKKIKHNFIEKSLLKKQIFYDSLNIKWIHQRFIERVTWIQNFYDNMETVKCIYIFVLKRFIEESHSSIKGEKLFMIIWRSTIICLSTSCRLLLACRHQLFLYHIFLQVRLKESVRVCILCCRMQCFLYKIKVLKQWI